VEGSAILKLKKKALKNPANNIAGESFFFNFIWFKFCYLLYKILNLKGGG
jgi:hypothetical protein